LTELQKQDSDEDKSRMAAGREFQKMLIRRPTCSLLFFYCYVLLQTNTADSLAFIRAKGHGHTLSSISFASRSWWRNGNAADSPVTEASRWRVEWPHRL